MYKLCYFVPESHLEQTKQAIFETGAGRVGDYDSCAWQTRGQGQFRPLDGSRPYLGQQGAVEKVDEYKVELVCTDDVIRLAIGALKQAHPYEEPAYDVFRMEAFE
ncbi:YqfO family protein [Marinobacter nanhaiticus D15-8W]|uniref:NGG1p interacting factor NIF3 n=1 Tax=Marinobacter nanhaiticus D15-8W TaxID=626887 RepID=N6X0Y0_9GAMM|nr:YqfO family protein [Marinobacter nanhaiticus]ENO17092.1 NGG1p interacting factor NIF3 [Marinobacter nanhaiticus D15-8W]BES71910.1 YqfO family protein [Marinobacter nanhaiticus D15-8W]